MQIDKVKHFGAGLLITVLFGILSPLLGLIIGIFAGWLKERIDKNDPANHTYDGWDAYATAAGALAGYLVIQFCREWLIEVLNALAAF